MDGTLYLGDKLFDFTKRLLNKIKESSRNYLFLTNNSSKNVADYVKKLKKLGIEARMEDFLTSSQATTFYLHKNLEGKNLYVCGTKSLIDELKNEGFLITDDIEKTECVVMGFDTELTFKKLEDVCKILLSKDVPYIATNPDLVCPTEFGSVPDCGSVCEMIFNATGKRPFVIGKPSALMPMLAMEKMGVNPDETAVVGDRIYTDIKSGINAGAISVLVLSGETNYDILKSSEDKPDFVMQDAGELIKYL